MESSVATECRFIVRDAFLCAVFVWFAFALMLHRYAIFACGCGLCRLTEVASLRDLVGCEHGCAATWLCKQRAVGFAGEMLFVVFIRFDVASLCDSCVGCGLCRLTEVASLRDLAGREHVCISATWLCKQCAGGFAGEMLFVVFIYFDVASLRDLCVGVRAVSSYRGCVATRLGGVRTYLRFCYLAF
jgi:hypothetical protein